MSHLFEVGKQYRNRNGVYTVLKLDDDTMILRYADGRIVKDSVELQARIWENMLDDATYGEELDYVNEHTGGAEHKTLDIRELVVRVLRRISQPWPPDVIDQVFLAIERQPEWLAEYYALEKEFSKNTLNSFIGFHVKDVTGMENSEHIAVAKSKLVKSYSILAPRAG